MEIFEKNFDINKFPVCVLALGNFDGVHIGHTSLFHNARQYAKDNNISFGVYTFSDAPKFKNPDHSILTDRKKRVEMIEKFSCCDFLYFENFSDVKDYSVTEFVEYVVQKFNCVCCVCGENFTFAKGAMGNADTLKHLMQEYNRQCIVVESKMFGDSVVSATLIKQLINNGDVQTASSLLQYYYGFSSEIVHGEHIGHSIGFPTINQKIPKELVYPKFGVYSTLVVVDGKEYMGVTNFGVKPTVSKHVSEPYAETYIIDFDGDIYGKTAQLNFLKMQRSEKHFSGLDELKKNIAMDVENTKMFFKEKKNEAK